MRPARRDRQKDAFWRRVIEGQPRSGMSIRAWSRKQAVWEPSFCGCRTQLVRRDAQAPTFVPVRVTAGRSAINAFDPSAVNGSQSRIEIVWPAQRRVRRIGPLDGPALNDVLARFAPTPIQEIDRLLPDRWANREISPIQTAAASA